MVPFGPFRALYKLNISSVLPLSGRPFGAMDIHNIDQRHGGFQAQMHSIHSESEHLLALDPRLSLRDPEILLREQKIHKEVEQALKTQERSRARKSTIGGLPLPYDRTSILKRAHARHNPDSGAASHNNGMQGTSSHYSSFNNFVEVPRAPVLSRVKEQAMPCLSFSPAAQTQPPFDDNDDEDEASLLKSEHQEKQVVSQWRKKLEHLGTLIVLGYDPDAKRPPYL
ncbi:hypothetical protein H0H93_014206 [Arthromyces matolae]|nr:hypothetical protein H0H93_014206 [Arthromyces matolae]